MMPDPADRNRAVPVASQRKRGRIAALALTTAFTMSMGTLFAAPAMADVAGTGVVILPMSVARLHQRKDVVSRVVSDLDPTTIALVWRLERDDDVTQAFVGVTKGRTANTSR